IPVLQAQLPEPILCPPDQTPTSSYITQYRSVIGPDRRTSLLGDYRPTASPSSLPNHENTSLFTKSFVSHEAVKEKMVSPHGKLTRQKLTNDWVTEIRKYQPLACSYSVQTPPVSSGVLLSPTVLSHRQP
ncbi:Trehalose-phosphatase, partial [Dissostichus eleginoides]